MTETLAYISMISYIGFGVFLVLTIILFFTLHIPTVIGDLSGRNARKSIEKMRKKNEKESRIENKKESNTNNRILFETDVLKENHGHDYGEEVTSLLWEEDTQLLAEEDKETTILHEPGSMQNRRNYGGIELSMIEEKILVHTKEVIL